MGKKDVCSACGCLADGGAEHDAKLWGYVEANPWRAIDLLKEACGTTSALWGAQARSAIEQAMGLSGAGSHSTPSLLDEFNRLSSFRKTKQGFRITCRKGLWWVDAPTEEEARREAMHYFLQYFSEGEYDQ